MADVRTNLLKNRQILSEKDYQREKDVLKSSVIGLVVVVTVVIALFVWNLVLSIRLNRIDAAVKSANTQMQGLTQANVQQVYLKSRLQLVTGFLSDRSIVRESLQKIFTTDIPEVHVAQVSFESDNVLGVQYVANARYPLEQLLAYYETDTGYFTQTVSRSLSRDKDGIYQVSLAFRLPKGDK